MKLSLHLFICLLTLSGAVLASDKAKEKRWADQIVDAIMVGEAVWLEAGKDKFLGLYTEQTSEIARGAAIVLHGTGVHPNWPDVIYPLRTQLPDHGWHTLSLQMPILHNEAKYAEYIPLYEEVAPRINAAVAYLKSKGINNIVIIGHSLGPSMAAYALANNTTDPSIRAFVAIGVAGDLIRDEKKNFFTSLTKIKMPILDIYGGEDLDNVRDNAKKRSSIAKKSGNKNYTQIEVPAANHFFNNQGDTLVKRVRGWLEKHAAGTEIKK